MSNGEAPSKMNGEQRVAEAIAQGAALQQAGKLREAELIYRQVLEVDPRHAQALTLMGLIHLQREEPAEALRLLDLSLEIEPRQLPALLNRGKALGALGRHREALTSYDRAVALKPDAAQPHYLRGNAHAAMGLYAEAVSDFDRAIEREPRHERAFNDRGNALQALGRFDEAQASFERAIALKPDAARAYFNRANLLQRQGRLDDAVANYRMALKRDPDFAAAHNNLGNALRACGRHDEAIACYDTVIRLRPDHPQAYNNRGSTLQSLGRLADAIACYDKAIALKPDYAQAHYNRGNLLNASGRADEALASFERAIALDAAHVQAWNNRGLLLQSLGRHDEALESFDRAIALAPEDAIGYWNKSLLKLLRGEFAEGWRLYEWRRRNEHLNRPQLHFQEPLWLGEEPLEGKTILLHDEQGFGDTIQFSRYVERVAALGATVLLKVQSPLKSLMQTLDGPSQVVSHTAAFLRFDYQTPLLSLPLAFGTDLESIPARVPYLRAEPECVAKWQERLGARSGLRVGLAWSGRPSHANDRNRSIPLAELLPLLACDAAFVGLQKEVRSEDEPALGSADGLTNHGPSLESFADTAGLIETLDLVISVDTAVAHLAGALGKPVWILLPSVPDWRWLLEREDSPWYPSARLFRQDDAGGWPPVVARVGRALNALAASGDAGA